LEQQAKERLTGGVILVILLVLLVPELLTGPRPVLAPIPAQPDQAPMRSYTLELGEAPRANRGPVAASTAAPPADPVAVSSAPLPDTPAPAAASAPARTPSAAAPRVPAAAPAPPHGAGTWIVQLGTFSSRENAARLVSGLKSHGFSAAISEVMKNGHKLFRVRVGAERDRACAVRLQGRLKAAGEKGGENLPR
jgi:cell division septation protein DedD